jgi:hypothetical protein
MRCSAQNTMIKEDVVTTVQTSSSNTIPQGYQVVQRYPRVTVDAGKNDYAGAVQDLVANVTENYPAANWILGIRSTEIQDVETSVTGYPYQLIKNVD